MIKKFKEKLKYDGKTIKWFIQKYLPDVKYHTFVSQINGFAPLNKRYREKIQEYLEE